MLSAMGVYVFTQLGSVLSGPALVLLSVLSSPPVSRTLLPGACSWLWSRRFSTFSSSTLLASTHETAHYTSHTSQTEGWSTRGSTQHWMHHTQHWMHHTQHWMHHTQHRMHHTQHWTYHTQHWMHHTQHWIHHTQHWIHHTHSTGCITHNTGYITHNTGHITHNTGYITQHWTHHTQHWTSHTTLDTSHTTLDSACHASSQTTQNIAQTIHHK